MYDDSCQKKSAIVDDGSCEIGSRFSSIKAEVGSARAAVTDDFIVTD